MKTKYLICCVCVLGAAVFASDDQGLVSRYLRYRDLPRITKEKIEIPKATRMMCLDPRITYGPHYNPAAHIYANAVAIKARKREPNAPRYPIGSMLVKEKFDSEQTTKPGIITVMEKIANDGSVDDWRFMMIRISDRTVVREGFKISCAACHAHYTTTDFVSIETDRLLSAYAKK